MINSIQCRYAHYNAKMLSIEALVNPADQFTIQVVRILQSSLTHLQFRLADILLVVKDRIMDLTHGQNQVNASHPLLFATTRIRLSLPLGYKELCLQAAPRACLSIRVTIDKDDPDVNEDSSSNMSHANSEIRPGSYGTTPRWYATIIRLFILAYCCRMAVRSAGSVETRFLVK